MSPSLILLWDVLRALENGFAIGVGVQNYLKRSQKDEFYYQIKTWWLARHNPNIHFEANSMNLGRQQLLKIIEMGLNGESVVPHLKSLENELILSCEDEIQKFTALLPLKILFPLLCLILPSMLLLLVIPLLRLLQF